MHHEGEFWTIFNTGNCKIKLESSRGLRSLTPPGLCPGLQHPPDPQLARAMTYGHCMCMIKICRGEGVVDGEGGSIEKCLKWGGGGH